MIPFIFNKNTVPHLSFRFKRTKFDFQWKYKTGKIVRYAVKEVCVDIITQQRVQ